MSAEAREFWDSRYSSKDRIWSKEPNRWLPTFAGRLSVGSALDVGCGEGADMVWLATRGWRVTGIDISGVAVQRASQEIESLGLQRLATAVRADLVDDPIPGESFDFVSSQYFHVAPPARSVVLSKLADSLAIGGHLLVVGHFFEDLQRGFRQPPDAGVYWDAEELAESLGNNFLVLEAGTRQRPGTTSSGSSAAVNDVVVFVRRTG